MKLYVLVHWCRAFGSIQVEKAGATLLFEDPATRGNTIGVVVNPVRIASLKDFGSLNEVADKLIAAERRKVTSKEPLYLNLQDVRDMQFSSNLVAYYNCCAPWLLHHVSLSKKWVLLVSCCSQAQMMHNWCGCKSVKHMGIHHYMSWSTH